MAELMSQIISSHRFQLAATAVVAGASVACIILGYQALEREERLSELKSSIPSLEESEHNSKRLTSYGTSSEAAVDKEDARNQALARRAQAGEWDEELILEQLARNRVFLTDDGLRKLREAFVIVVGCGGVGSHCTAALARSGVARLRLIDFDQVTLSSLNRHAVATLADVGTPKVHCLQRRLLGVTPWVQFDLRQGKFDETVAHEMLGPWEDGQSPSFIVDAIDNIETKVELLRHCYDKQLPVVSSMGAGTKSDPTRVLVGDISMSTDDGLSRSVRRRLKLMGIMSGIPVVFSTEKGGEGKAELQPLSEEEVKRGTVGDLGVMENFRVRILPVLGTIPAIFGYTVANHVVLSLAGYPINYVAGKGRDKMYDGALTFLQASEERLARLLIPGGSIVGLKVPLTQADAAFLVDDVYKGRSILSGLSTRLALIRWERPGERSFDTVQGESQEQKCSTVALGLIVAMTRDEASRHEKEHFKERKPLEEIYDQGTIANVEARLAIGKEYEKFR